MLLLLFRFLTGEGMNYGAEPGGAGCGYAGLTG